jgi:2-methylisocitrate lyase-like PEP mutase family enzyme
MTPTSQTQLELARRFRDLHAAEQPLILANAWDVGAARILQAAGAPAIATTSAGVAWSLGVADGDHLGRDQALDVIARVVAAVDLPVSADIEAGYGADPSDVADTVAGVIAAGAVGINIEDAHHSGPQPLRSTGEQAERIAAARQAAEAAAVPLFVNARIDTYLAEVGDPSGRLADTLRRAQAYVAAGADGIFVPGVTDPAVVAPLADGVGAPLNVLAGPGAPGVTELARLGARRISLGSSIAAAAYAVLRRAADEAFQAGTYSSLAGGMSYADINAVMTDRPH